MKNIILPKQSCVHMYSRSIGEPRPRKCVHCGEPEPEEKGAGDDYPVIAQNPEEKGDGY